MARVGHGAQLRASTRRVQVLGKASEWPRALHLLRSLQGRADLIALSATLKACREVWAQGLQLLSLGQDVVTYGALASACERGGWRCCGALLADMLGARVEPSAVVVHCLGLTWRGQAACLERLGLQGEVSTLNAWLATASWSQALRFLSHFGHRNVLGDAISRNAAATALRGKWRLGQLYVHQVPKELRDLQTYNCLATGGRQLWPSFLLLLSLLRMDGFQPDVFSLALGVGGSWMLAQSVWPGCFKGSPWIL